MNEFIIKKAKVIDDTFMEIEYTECQPDGDSTTQHEIKALMRNRVHQDLLLAYEKLKVHMALLCESLDPDNYEEEQFSTGEIYTLLEFEKFKVMSFSIGGEGDSQGVTISGRRALRGKRILNLNAPFTKFDKLEGLESYEFLDLMVSDLFGCIEEVKAYLGGKHAPNPQQEISFQ